MKRLHLILGLVVLVVFLLTGQYMEYVHNRTLPDGQRMLYRSRHIYFLLAGLVNLGIGLYFTYRPNAWRRILQVTGSLLLMIAPVIVLTGFFYEPALGPAHTTVARWGIYAVAAGTVLHLFASLRSSA